MEDGSNFIIVNLHICAGSVDKKHGSEIKRRYLCKKNSIKLMILAVNLILFFWLQPLPPTPGAIDPYGDPFGSERGSIVSGHGTGKYTLQSRQVMTVSDTIDKYS